ncbi:MAG: class I SAM-dependent methyltransferase [Elusimicrobia bacterium]|nr:class I SAM-dependent methyltransferase [Elusimicrobiota bacterium]
MGTSKRDSVWHNFRGSGLGIMRAPARAHHPSRWVVDELMRTWFDDRSFDWLDVGVVGMVDYERLRPSLRFRFTGVDLSESVLEDARQYLRGPSDAVTVWDIQEPPDARLVASQDLITVRHVLNHCEYYDRPLEHAAAILRPGGRIVVVLHLALVDGPDELRRHHAWDVPGEVIGNRYGRERFVRTFGSIFVPELWVRVDDGVKPNDVIVGRRPLPGEALPPPRLERYRMWVPPGRRHLFTVLWSRMRLARHLRRVFARTAGEAEP